jgi:hypothetical protein
MVAARRKSRRQEPKWARVLQLLPASIAALAACTAALQFVQAVLASLHR